ncbi:hypothetical protein Tco_0812990 [Tanacetum coccineum]
MAQQLGLLSNLRAHQRYVDLFEYHFQVLLMISEARSLNLYPIILCHLAILCLYPHAHYLESLLTISLNIDLLLDLLAILSLMFFEEVLVEFKRISLTGFRSCTSRSRDQSVSKQTTRWIYIESRKSPTAELFDVDSGRIFIVTVNTKEYHSVVLANITRIMHSISALLLFGDQKLERTATFSISRISE